MISKTTAQSLKRQIAEHVEATREDAFSGSYEPAECELIRREFHDSTASLDKFIDSITVGGGANVLRWNTQSIEFTARQPGDSHYVVSHWAGDEVWHREDIGVTVIPADYLYKF